MPRNAGSWTKETRPIPRNPGRKPKSPEQKALDQARLKAEREAERLAQRIKRVRRTERLLALAKQAAEHPSVKKILEEAVAQERQGVKDKVIEGLTRTEPKHALGFIRLAAEYLDGRPVETVKLDAPPPVVVILSQDKRLDPLALGPRSEEEAVFSEDRPAMPANGARLPSASKPDGG